MRILFVVDSLSGGGAGRVVAEIASCLACQEDEIAVDVVSESTIEYAINQKVQVFNGTIFKQKHHNSLIAIIDAIANANKSFKPDVIVSFLTVNNIATILATLWSPVKVIVSERNDPNYSPSQKHLRVLRKLLYRFANGFVFQTHEIQGFFSKEIQEKSTIIHNPINPDIPTPYSGERSDRIVMAGRLTEQKNYPMAISAFRNICNEFNEYSLEIYGEGRLKTQLEKLIEKEHLKGRVKLMGQSYQLFQDIRDAKLFLMTSDYEGLSNSLMEALALGLPVITTDHGGGGARELIKDGVNGILVPIGDHALLAKKMEEVLENKTYRDNLGVEAQKIRYTDGVKCITNRWKSYITEIVGEKVGL